MQSDTFKSYKDELLEDLKDKDFRDAFVSAHMNEGIPFQIRTIRNNKKLTQEELGKLTQMKQTAISRLENPNCDSYTLKTLKEIASAFDVALIVRFVSYSDLVKWDLNLSPETLNALSYKDDPYFKNGIKKESHLSLTISLQQSNQHINISDMNRDKNELFPYFKQSQHPSENAWAVTSMR